MEENLIEVILNKQETSLGGRRIDVTGLYIRLLPAAEAAGAPAPLAQVELANVGCVPMAAAGRVPTDGAGNPVPTQVNAGSDVSGTFATSLLALLAALAALGTFLAVRRARP